MSIEEDLGRQLHAKAGVVKVTPDLADLTSRIKVRERKSQRHERMALGAAVVVLAGSVGGLTGAVIHRPRAAGGNSVQVGDNLLGGTPANGDRSSVNTPKPAATAPIATAAQTIVSESLPGSLNVSASLQSLTQPVAIANDATRTWSCASVSILTTTVGEDGEFAGATSVVSLPTLSPSGFEILDSGALQVSGGGQVWWMSVAAGSDVSRVAAENIGGGTVASGLSHGIAVLAGPMTGTGVGSAGYMSAVAESGDGATLQSFGFELGQGPKVVGESAGAGQALPGCSRSVTVSDLPATSGQPADESLAAASVVSAYEQAYSQNALLGYSANLSAVSGGAALASTASSDRYSVVSPAEQSRSSGVAVGVSEIDFTSPDSAAVVYSTAGVELTGSATLGTDGIWRVSRSTFCDAIAAGVVPGSVPAGVSAACR